LGWNKLTGVKPRLTLEARLAAILAAAVTLSIVLAVLLAEAFQLRWLAILVALAVALPLSVWGLRGAMAPVNRYLQTLIDAVGSLRDGDLSVSISDARDDELGQMARAYNGVGEILRRERQNLYQRELLLDTVIQASPLALVLTQAAGRIVYSNAAARRLFNHGRKMEGAAFENLLAAVPASLREAALGGRDGLYTVEAESEPDVYHVSRQTFTLNTREHRLYLFKQLTRELARQELATWKKVIRLMSHELNNSLAPISSLAHSGRLLARGADPGGGTPAAGADAGRLDRIFGTIEERSQHLKHFLEEYVRFAKLPRPKPQQVEWTQFLDYLQGTVPFRRNGAVAGTGWFDQAQLEQVLINLLKNAHEAGGPAEEIALDVRREGGGTLLRVLDRGRGMSETVLHNALLPFYSTKSNGSGLGLTLSREIIDAHGGRLALFNRPEGGLEVRVWLPEAPIF
jgi:two-component system, NtrC family, nitrogen regulation sensor histidine kinase NtrY